MGRTEMKDLETFYREDFGIQSQNLLDWAILHTTVRTLEKGEPLIHAGEPQRKLCFLCSGVLRGFSVDKKVRTQRSALRRHPAMR